MASGLCFGDAIFCEFLRSNGHDNWGFISAGVTTSGHICMAKGSIDNPPVDIGECLWTVEPLHQHVALRELRVHMDAVATVQAALGKAETTLETALSRARTQSSLKLLPKSNSTRGLAIQAGEDVKSYKKSLKNLDKLTIQLKKALEQEIRFNDKLALRRKGDPIAFGQPVSTYRCVCKCGRSCLFYARWNGCFHVRCDGNLQHVAVVVDECLNARKQSICAYDRYSCNMSNRNAFSLLNSVKHL